jgi:hypothetical protein
MQDQPPSPGEEPRPRRITDEDAMVSRAVLSLAVSFYPAPLPIAELNRQLSKSQDDAAIERAINDLVTAGLLHRDDHHIVATRIALNLYRLNLYPPPDPPPKPNQNGS